MKYYIISGEASGDLHAANLVLEIKKKDKEAEIRAWGGEKIQAAGATLVKHYKETAFMGFTQVLANLKTIKSLFAFCKEDILAFHPDIVIFVDYPGFNLRMAEFTHQQGFKNYYYISPKIWAWKKKRAYKIKAFIDKMFVIFPFEIDFYKKYDYRVNYIGNPLLDEIEKQKETLPELDDFIENNSLEKKPIIALLSGSRKQEITNMLPKMVKLSAEFPKFQFIVAGAPGITPEFYSQFLSHSSLKIVYSQTYALLKNAEAGIITSGTATLEAALFRLPQVVVYAANFISYAVARMVVKIEHISLVNIILKKAAVTELIQYDFNINKLKQELNAILNTSKKDEILEDYTNLFKIMGEKGASERAAEIIFKDISKK